MKLYIEVMRNMTGGIYQKDAGKEKFLFWDDII